MLVVRNVVMEMLLEMVVVLVVSLATEVSGGDRFGDGDDDGVMGRTMDPQRHSCPNPGTYECVTLYGQGELRLLIS